MRLISSVSLILIICIWSCNKKDHNPEPPSPPSDTDIIAAENSRLSAVVTNQTATAFISGTIMDEDGKTLQGATVTAGNATATTNDKGYFQFPSSVAVNKDYAIITASLNGYFKAIKTFTPNASGKANHYFEIKLLKTGAEKTVPANGGNVVVDNKIDLTFPDAAVVTSTGATYTEQYKVIARYIDPASNNFLETMPGILAGLNDQNQVQALQSFGMAAVELKDASGNPLQIAPGKTVTLKLPAANDGPATIPLWHFNEKYGIWIKAGTATKSGNLYTAEVNHFSTWNLDLEFNSFKLDLQFKDQAGNALPGLHIEAYIDGVSKIKSFYTDNEGKATLINCPASKPLTIKTIFQCDTILKTLDPLTANRSEIVTISSGSGPKFYTLTGKITGCDNTALANQPFQIAIQGNGSSNGIPGVTDAQGNYTVTGAICNSSNTAAVQAIAFIENQFRYASVLNITSTNNVYNAKICDTSSVVDDSFQILFPDPALDSVIRMKINKPSGTILYGEVKNIDTLNTYYSSINDISGIQFCTNLKVLSLPVANFSDLSLLKNLLNLQNLQISEARDGLITDISPLQNLSQLQTLTLVSGNLSNISPLQSLGQLKNLSLTSNSLSDISALSGLTQMNWLQLIGNSFNNLSSLQNLTQLKTLQVSSNTLTKSNLDILQNFNQLTDLTISGTSISDFSAVKNLSQLEYLHLKSNQISDVSQFTTLTKLISLELDNNKITDISALQTMTQLEYINLSGNEISNIASLQNLTLLKSIDLGYNIVFDLSPLQNLNKLELLGLHGNRINDITPLINGVPNLYAVSIWGQPQPGISKAQQDAFASSHPNCGVSW